MNLDKSTEFIELINKAKENKNVLAVVLFGSYANKREKMNSDIDVCIFKKDINQIEGFEDLFGYDNVDLVFFSNLSQVLKFKIFTEGKILYIDEEYEQDFYKLRRKFVRSYIDFEPARQRQWRRVLANV